MMASKQALLLLSTQEDMVYTMVEGEEEGTMGEEAGGVAVITLQAEEEAAVSLVAASPPAPPPTHSLALPVSTPLTGSLSHPLPVTRAM